MSEYAEMQPLHFPWYRRLWFWFRNWRARRLACKYTVTSEELADNLYKARPWQD